MEQQDIVNTVTSLIDGYPDEWELFNGYVKCSYLDIGVSVTTGYILSGGNLVAGEVDGTQKLLSVVRSWIINKLEGD